MAPEYHQASRKEKGKILDELIHLTGYTRTNTSFLLANHGRRRFLQEPPARRYRAAGASSRTKRNRKKIYDEEVLTSLKKI